MNDLALTTDLQTKVVEKIKSSFMELIPDIAWDELVKKQTNLFITRELPTLIKSELELFFRSEMKKELEKPEFVNGGYGDHGERPGEAVKQIIKDLAPDFVAAIFGNIAQNAVMQIKNNLNMY